MPVLFLVYLTRRIDLDQSNYKVLSPCALFTLIGLAKA